MRRFRWAMWSLLLAAGHAAAAHSPPEKAVLEPVLERWNRDERADLKAVVVMRDGALVAERYYNGETPETLHDIRSAGKSITALLVGAAIERGEIQSVSDTIGAYVPEARNKAVGSISIRDLLTMRSGLDADDENPESPGNEDLMDESADPFGFALSVPQREPAGTRYVYNSLTAYLAGITAAKAVGRPLDEFAGDILFRPLGIQRWRWSRDASGWTKGQGNLSLTARDLAKIGQLVLDRGVHGGRRIVSEQWIAESLEPRIAISAVDPYADHYGYYWYAKTHRIGDRDVAVRFASGNGGNKLYVVPSLNLVVAITSSAYGRGYGQRRSQEILLAVLAAVIR